MGPIKRGELDRHIEWAKAELLNTGKIIDLETKENSVCHFFQPFEIENDSIVLRLDWSKPDIYGNPTLDADFYDNNTKKKRTLSGQRKEAHHTPTTKPGEGIYYWQFKSGEKRFRVMIGWLGSAKISVGASCTAKAEVIKGNEKPS